MPLRNCDCLKQVMDVVLPALMVFPANCIANIILSSPQCPDCVTPEKDTVGKIRL